MRKRKHPLRYLKQLFCSLFLLCSLASVFFLQSTLSEIKLPQAGEQAELLANQINDDLTKIFTEAIYNAEQSIHLVVYSLTDPQIIKSLRQRSHEGIDVRVVCDAKASPYIDRKLGPKIHTTRRFGPGLMHQKILVIDGKQVWLGSANMTSESLRMHGNLVTALNDTAIAETITTKIRTLKVEGHDQSFVHQDFMIGGQRIELWFLPDNMKAVGYLKSLIQSAQKTIRVAMFTWTRQDLAQEIIEASKRGVKTEVVIDHYSGKGVSAKVVTLLKKHGVDVSLSQGGPLLHHKFMYIDQNLLVNGSANWTKAAFSQNDDCFIVMHDLNEQQKSHMDRLWRTISVESERVKEDAR